MREYEIESKYKYRSRTVTKGTQEKFRKNNYYYKVNKTGNEGLVEYLVYRIMKNSNIPEVYKVRYEYCIINGKRGCRSRNFLKDGEVFVSMSTIYERVAGSKNLSNKLMQLDGARERLKYIVNVAHSAGITESKYIEYLKTMLQLDLLILNTDRHEHNYGIIYNLNYNKYRISPIFDNGMSLNTNRTGNMTACTISGSFEDQIVAFGYPIVPAFKIDYKRLKADLNRIEKTYGKHMEIEILRKQLDKYERLFSMR